MRQEELGQFKPYFAAMYPETYHGVADLYVYFYQQGFRLIRVGGRMSYIVTNKWMRAGYGQPLRTFFAKERALERVIDFGHAPIFEDADVFPCILVLEKPMPQLGRYRQSEHQVQVLHFPRTELGQITRSKGSLGRYIQEYSHSLSHSRFSNSSWNLESSAVDDLRVKIHRVGVPLTEFAGVKPAYGIKTGLNEAFLIDTSTRNHLIRDDPHASEILRPYLRGRDIKRWSPEWAGLWMIFTRRGTDIDMYPTIKQHLLQFREQLEPRPSNWGGKDWPGRKPGPYQWYELQDTVDYWQLFDQPKIIWKDLSTYSEFCFDSSGLFTNDLCFILTSEDKWLLAVLNSPLMWYYLHRVTMHAINETLRLKNIYMEPLPIASPTEAIRVGAEQAVARLIEITQTRNEVRRLVLDWLRIEFELQEPGTRLGDFTTLDLPTFVEEVRKHRAKTAGKLTPAALKGLQSGYTEQIAPLQQYRTEAMALERKLSDFVNAAYGLTPEETALLWTTAPPRMPLSPQH